MADEDLEKSKLLETIKACIFGLDIPYLVSPPGWGKNAMMTVLARGLDARLFTVYLAHVAGNEIHGIPVVRREPLRVGDRDFTVVEMAPRREAIEASEHAGCSIVFFDEINHLSAGDVSQVMAILTDRTWGGVRLDPARVAMACAGNPPEYSAGSWDLPLPLVRRITRIPLALSAAAFASPECFPANWGAPLRPGEVLGRTLDDNERYRQRALIAGWVHAHPDVLEGERDPAKMREGFVSPASLEHAADLSAAVEQYTPAPLRDSVRTTLLRGKLGPANADALVEYIDKMDVPDSRDILDDPHKFLAAEKLLPPDKLYYLLMSLSTEVWRRTQASGGSKAAKSKLLEVAQRSWCNALDVVARLLDLGAAQDVLCLTMRDLVKDGSRPAKVTPPLSAGRLTPLTKVLSDAGVNWVRLGR